MAIKTMAMSEGSGQYAEGWHELTISKAEYSSWKDDQVLDIWFKDYPDTFKVRIFPAVSKENNEEFAIARVFKVVNAGIVSVLKDANGKNPVIQYDDEASGLVDRNVNVFMYKSPGSDGKEYSNPFNRFAPVVGEGEHLSYTADDVSFWKKNVEAACRKYQEKRKTTTTTDEFADVPY
jgi:hypothetical protein